MRINQGASRKRCHLDRLIRCFLALGKFKNEVGSLLNREPYTGHSKKKAHVSRSIVTADVTVEHHKRHINRNKAVDVPLVMLYCLGFRPFRV